MAQRDSQPAAGPSRALIPVLAGGGARLPAYIGILSALEELQIEVRHLVGVSGGSIVAALRAAGYSLDAIRQVAMETNFADFLGQNLVSLLRTGGLSSGQRFERWIDEKLDGRCFGDLDTALTVIATDVRSGEAAVFSSEGTPELRVSRAVRYSMSVPLLFSFLHDGSRVMTDGSILAEEALRSDWSGDGTPVVIFKLRGHGGLEAPRGMSLIPLRGYLAMLINSFMTTVAHEFVSDSMWLSSVFIDVGDISPMAFSLTPADNAQLFEAGYVQTLDHLPRKLASRDAVLAAALTSR